MDDIDRLFARLERTPAPEELTARVLASTVARTEAAQAGLAWPWLLAGLGAIALLSLAGYQLGARLASSDGLVIVEMVLSDLTLLATAPGDVLAALGEVVPWELVVLAGLSAAVLVWVAGHLVARTPTALRPRSAA